MIIKSISTRFEKSHSYSYSNLKAGVHLKPVFPPLNLGLMRISRLRFKQSRKSMLISQSDDKRCFVNFLVIFGDVWKEIVFLKGLVKFGEIRNIKDLM